MTVHLSYSRVKTHLTFCPYSNRLKYVEQVEPTVSWKATEFGKVIHDYIAGLYCGREVILPAGDRYDCFKTILQKEYLLDDAILVEGQNPLLWLDDRHAGLLQASLSSYDIVGVPDVITQPNNSTLVITDYKSGKLRLSKEELAVDGQMILYRWLLEKNGYRANRWLFNHCYITQSGKNVKWVTADSGHEQYRGAIELVLRQVDYVYKQEVIKSHFPPVAGFDHQTCRICSYKEKCPFSIANTN